MIKEKISITVVLDEFGGTSGVVTLEDLMEEIFGEIEDEFDSDNLTEKQAPDGSFIFSARLEIDYLNEKYDLGLKESEEYETIGGFIINQNEDIPKKGDTFVFDDFEFKILKASNTKIELIKMKKIS
jgi:CBS domain containing-hemolysin-like protein